MARSTAVLLEQLLRFLPPQYRAASDILGGLAAQLAQVEASGDDLVLATTIDGAEDEWLTLLARGYGVRRGSSESDDTVRERIRVVDDALTRPAILDAVNALLAPYTATEATMYEHFDSGFFADVDYADQDDDSIRVYDQHNSFTLLVPDLSGLSTSYGKFALQPAESEDADAAYADADTYAVADSADTTEHVVYGAIQATVERLRAAGVRWWLLRDEP